MKRSRVDIQSRCKALRDMLDDTADQSSRDELRKEFNLNQCSKVLSEIEAELTKRLRVRGEDDECHPCLSEAGDDPISLTAIPSEFRIRLLINSKCQCYDARSLATWLDMGNVTDPLTRTVLSPHQIDRVYKTSKMPRPASQPVLSRQGQLIYDAYERAGVANPRSVVDLPAELSTLRNAMLRPTPIGLAALSARSVYMNDVELMQRIFDHDQFLGNGLLMHIYMHSGDNDPRMIDFLNTNAQWAIGDDRMGMLFGE